MSRLEVVVYYFPNPSEDPEEGPYYQVEIISGHILNVGPTAGPVNSTLTPMDFPWQVGQDLTVEIGASTLNDEHTFGLPLSLKNEATGFQLRPTVNLPVEGTLTVRPKVGTDPLTRPRGQKLARIASTDYYILG